MTYREALSRHTVAISISESADMAVFGLSEQHLRDAMTEVARHLLALGAQVVYGGDLRANGFTELLFELVARHRRDADDGDERAGVLNYLAWPVHIQMDMHEIEQVSNELKGAARLVLLDQHGQMLTMAERARITKSSPTDEEWEQGLTAMRKSVLANTHARIVLGGRVNQYRGAMPGIAQEALLTLAARQPLYAVGGFGGCARDIVETLGIVSPWTQAETDRAWRGRTLFQAFSSESLNNGLTEEENRIVAQTPHIDQAVALILRGLFRSGQVANRLPDV